MTKRNLDKGGSRRCQNESVRSCCQNSKVRSEISVQFAERTLSQRLGNFHSGRSLMIRINDRLVNLQACHLQVGLLMASFLPSKYITLRQDHQTNPLPSSSLDC